MTENICYLGENDLKLLNDFSRWLATLELNYPNLPSPAMPDLSPREHMLWQAMLLWIDTARASNPRHYDQTWLPRSVDFHKSRLFWRIRSGKKPLPEAPPCAFSCPWYEVVEENHPHWCSDVSPSGTWEDDRESPRWGPVVRVNQQTYKLVRKVSETEATIKLGFYQYRVWRGGDDKEFPITINSPNQKVVESTLRIKQWCIQRIVNMREETPWFPWA